MEKSCTWTLNNLPECFKHQLNPCMPPHVFLTKPETTSQCYCRTFNVCMCSSLYSVHIPYIWNDWYYNLVAWAVCVVQLLWLVSCDCLFFKYRWCLDRSGRVHCPHYFIQSQCALAVKENWLPAQYVEILYSTVGHAHSMGIFLCYIHTPNISSGFSSGSNNCLPPPRHALDGSIYVRIW